MRHASLLGVWCRLESVTILPNNRDSQCRGREQSIHTPLTQYTITSIQRHYCLLLYLLKLPQHRVPFMRSYRPAQARMVHPLTVQRCRAGLKVRLGRLPKVINSGALFRCLGDQFSGVFQALLASFRSCPARLYSKRVCTVRGPTLLSPLCAFSTLLHSIHGGQMVKPISRIKPIRCSPSVLW